MSIEIRDLVRHTTDTRQILLDHVSLEVPKGCFIALIGPSGAGKTTLLRAIAGLDPYDSGTITLDGCIMTDLQDRAGKMGFVFQHYALFPHMSVAQNIAFGLNILPARSRPSRKEIENRVQELLDLMQISGLGSMFPARLSGGQKQRVALARALATHPQVLLLDEPFGALDPIVRRSIRGWLRDLHDRLELTTVLVTHDQEEALDIADRVVIMQAGRIVQNAHPQWLDSHPATTFVMEFLGESISFSGIVQNGQMIPDEEIALPFAVPALWEDGPTIAMIRPYEIGLFPPNGQKINVEAIPRGFRNGYRHYTIQIKNRTIPLFVAQDAELPTQSNGVLVGTGLDIKRARLFRPEV
ncbi:MAG: ATP-binding cassette domain-containing protein [Acetobacter sp.]|nr:ATP-binding cassette domain-containing protein [Acetobacter sp.]